MASRDLTVTYLRMRSSLHRRAPGRDVDGPPGTLLVSSAGGGVDFAPLTGLSGSPIYVELVNEIQADIGTIQRKMEDLGRAHDERLRIGFDPAAEAEKEREIEILTSEITRHFNHGGAKLKRVAHAGGGAEGTEAKIRQNIQRSLASRLHELSGTFRGMQKAYLGQMNRMTKDKSLASLLGQGQGGAAADRDEGFTDEQVSALANAEEDVDERTREIQRIAKSIEDLAVLFKELATLVVEQGTILDRIDYNMEEVVVNTKKGLVELKQAEEYQKKGRPLKCMAVLMVLIIVMVIIIAIRKS